MGFGVVVPVIGGDVTERERERERERGSEKKWQKLGIKERGREFYIILMSKIGK